MATLIDTLVAGLDLDTGDPSPLQNLIEQALAQLTDKAGLPDRFAAAGQELEVFFNRLLGGSDALQQLTSGIGTAGESLASFAGQSGLGEAVKGVVTSLSLAAQAGGQQLQAAFGTTATVAEPSASPATATSARATSVPPINRLGKAPVESDGATASSQIASNPASGSLAERLGGSLATVLAQVFGNPQAQGALSAQAVAAGRVPGAPAIADAFVGMGWSREQASGLAANVLGSRQPGVTPRAGSANITARPDTGSDVPDAGLLQQLTSINQQLRTGSDKALGQRLAGASSAAQAGAILASSTAQPMSFGNLATPLSAAPAMLADIRPGAALRATASAPAGNNVQSETHIQTIEIHTQATDANAIARTIGPAISRNNLVQQAAGGDN